MKMQYELLSNKFDNQDTNASAMDLIRSMASGTRVHHASALKFGLREGFSRAVVEPTDLEDFVMTPLPSNLFIPPPSRMNRKR